MGVRTNQEWVDRRLAELHAARIEAEEASYEEDHERFHVAVTRALAASRALERAARLGLMTRDR